MQENEIIKKISRTFVGIFCGILWGVHLICTVAALVLHHYYPWPLQTFFLVILSTVLFFMAGGYDKIYRKRFFITLVSTAVVIIIAFVSLKIIL